MSGSHTGRPSSWLAVVIMIAGFTVGGLGLTLGPSWVLFWVGAGIVVLGALVGLVVGIFSDVVVDEPRVVPEEVDYSVLGRRSSERRGGPHGETTPEKTTKTDPQEQPHG